MSSHSLWLKILYIFTYCRLRLTTIRLLWQMHPRSMYLRPSLLKLSKQMPHGFHTSQWLLHLHKILMKNWLLHKITTWTITILSIWKEQNMEQLSSLTSWKIMPIKPISTSLSITSTPFLGANLLKYRLRLKVDNSAGVVLMGIPMGAGVQGTAMMAILGLIVIVNMKDSKIDGRLT